MKDAALTTMVFALLISLFALAANDWELPGSAPPPPEVEWCDAHEVALDDCPVCNPALARGGTQVLLVGEQGPGQCINTLKRITLAEGVAERVGLKQSKVVERKISETLVANGETHYLPDRLARVAPRVPGIIQAVKASVGQSVAAGDVLATLESPDLGRAKADYLQAGTLLNLRQKTYESEKGLYPRVTTARELLEAETAYEEARLAVQRAEQRLASMGLSPDRIAATRESRDVSTLHEVVAPFEGTVVDASAVPGETGGPGRPIFSVANMDRLWLSIDVHEEDLPLLEHAQRVSFFVEGLPGKRFPGRITSVGSEVDPKTRTVAVYGNVKNLQGLLRVAMFGRAEIRIRPAEPKLIAPKEAVHNDGECLLVFVSSSRNNYLARKIQVGAIFDGGYEIVSGLLPGDSIVTTGSFLLKTEILRGQIGVG